MATKPKTKSSAGGSLLELVMIVVVALGLALGIQAFLVKPYRIPSESMVPTLEIGQRVLVNRRYMGPEEVVEAGLLHDPAAAAAAAQDSEVPGEAVDAQALEEADLEAPADETAAEAPAGDTAEAPAGAEAAEDRG